MTAGIPSDDRAPRYTSVASRSKEIERALPEKRRVEDAMTPGALGRAWSGVSRPADATSITMKVNESPRDPGAGEPAEPAAGLRLLRRTICASREVSGRARSVDQIVIE
jgi:hypothetical protein